MIKKIKKAKDFEIEIKVNNSNFICTPQERQRNALLNQVVKEVEENLFAFNELAEEFLATNTNANLADKTQAELSDEEIMEDWQIPLMQSMVDEVAFMDTDILEIGFGRGVSADMIQEKKVANHTIIECNTHVIDRFNQWKENWQGKNISMVTGLWQDVIDDLTIYDAIFFHTYPLNQEEYLKYVHGKSTFAEHFFKDAAAHLKPNGRFTYMTNEIDSLSRAHQRQLLKNFSSFSLKMVKLNIPESAKDTWWINKMAVVTAVK